MEIVHVEKLFKLDIDMLKSLPWKRMKWTAGRPYMPRLCLPSAHIYFPICDLIPEVEKIFEMYIGLPLKITGCFGNYYRDGYDYIPDHADDYDAYVVTVSVGAKRLFRFRNKTTKKIIIPKYYLKDGDVMIFGPEINRIYKHGIPIQKSILKPRMSFTFFLE